MFHKTMARGFFIFSVLAGFLSAYGWATRGDIWLASTQWMQIASYLLLVGIYVRLSEQDDLDDIKKRRLNKVITKRKSKQKKRKTKK